MERVHIMPLSSRGASFPARRKAQAGGAAWTAERALQNWWRSQTELKPKQALGLGAKLTEIANELIWPGSGKRKR